MKGWFSGGSISYNKSAGLETNLEEFQENQG